MRCILNLEAKLWMGRILSSILLARGAKQIAPASKNKWVENWYRFWFYHFVPMVEESDASKKIVKHYPLDARMGRNAFDYKPDFPSTKNSSICEKGL